MKKLHLILLLVILISSEITAQVEYKIITSVESIVPAGLGRSRLISSDDQRDYEEFTSERSENKKEDGRNKSKRNFWSSCNLCLLLK